MCYLQTGELLYAQEKNFGAEIGIEKILSLVQKTHYT